jgi:hypothetical protein
MRHCFRYNSETEYLNIQKSLRHTARKVPRNNYFLGKFGLYSQIDPCLVLPPPALLNLNLSLSCKGKDYKKLLKKSGMTAPSQQTSEGITVKMANDIMKSL